MASRILCARRSEPRRGGGRGAIAPGGAFRPGGGAGRPVRGRQRRALFPFDPGADALLRCLLRLGVVGAANAAAVGHVPLARSGLASSRPGAAGAVPAIVRSRPPATARARRGAGLDRCGPRSSGSGCLLRPLQRRRGRTLLLRTVPGSLRSRPAQATRRLVHADGSGPLHGRPRGQGVEGRPRHSRGAGRGERLRARPLLRHRGLSGRSTAQGRRQPRSTRPGRARRRSGQAGCNRTGVRLRDHARALCRGPSASRIDDAGPRRAAHRRRDRTRRRVPDQRADGLGAAYDQTAAVPGA